MSGNVKLKEECVKVLRSILISAGDGLTVNKVLKDYCDVIGEELPYRKMGYVEAEDFFIDVPDAVRISYSRFGGMLLRGVANSETRHIDRMIKSQKARRTSGVGGFSKANQPPQRRRLRHPYSVRTESRAPPEPVVGPFMRSQIQQLLFSYTTGLLGSSFATAYTRRYGHELNFAKLGFMSLGDLLRSLTDIIDIEQLPGGGTRFHARKGQQSRIRSKLSDPPLPRPALSRQQGASGRVVGIPAGCEDDDLELVLDDRGDNVASPPSSISPTLSHSTGSISISKFFEDDGNISAELKKTVQGILENHPDGIWSTSFQDKYRRVTGDQLPIKRLGYTSMIEFMADLSDIVSIERQNERDWLLFDARTYKPSEKRDPKQSHHHDSNRGTDYGSTSDALGARYATPTLDLLLKEQIRQVVAYHKEGVQLSHIEAKFKALTGKEIPVEKLGFASIDTLICSAMSDILDLEYKSGGELIVTALNKNIPTDHLLINASDLAGPQAELPKPKCMSHMPVDAVGPGIGYTLQKLPKKTEFREVFVSNINSPGNFWLQLKGMATTDTLELLMDKLEEVYYGVDADRYNMPDEMVAPGQVCVAVYPQDDNWHRGLITGIKNLDFVEVYYYDYGNTGAVPRNGVKLLKNIFMILPAQAIPARLANIAPLDGKKWDPNAGRHMLSLVANRPLIALVTQVSKDNELSVCLTDTSGEDDIHINDILVNETYARFQPDDEIMEPDETVADEIVHTIEEHSAKERYLEEVTLDQPPEEVPYLETSPGPAEVKRFVKRLHLGSKHRLHVINFDMQPFAASGDISLLFWKDDLLRSQLRRKKLNIEREVIAKAEYEQIFQELASFKVKGVIDSEGEIKPHITIYNVYSIIHLLDVFDNPEKVELTMAVENVLAEFDPQEEYWLVPPPEDSPQVASPAVVPQESRPQESRAPVVKPAPEPVYLPPSPLEFSNNKTTVKPAPEHVYLPPSPLEFSNSKTTVPSPERKPALRVESLSTELGKLQVQSEPAKRSKPQPEVEPELSLEDLKAELQTLQAQRKAMLQQMMQESDSITSSLSVEELNSLEGQMMELRAQLSQAQKAKPADDVKKPAAAVGKAQPQRMAIVQPQSPQRPASTVAEQKEKVAIPEKAKPAASSKLDVMSQLSAMAAAAASATQATSALADQTHLAAEDPTGPSTRQLQEALEANERLLESVLMNQAQLMSQGYLPQTQPVSLSQSLPQPQQQPQQQPSYPMQPASQSYQPQMPAFPSSNSQMQAGISMMQPGYSQPSQIRGASYAGNHQYPAPSQPGMASAYSGAALYANPQGGSQQLDPNLLPPLTYLPAQTFMPVAPPVNISEAMRELNYMASRSGQGRGTPSGMVPMPRPGPMYPR